MNPSTSCGTTDENDSANSPAFQKDFADFYSRCVEHLRHLIHDDDAVADAFVILFQEWEQAHIAPVMPVKVKKWITRYFPKRHYADLSPHSEKYVADAQRFRFVHITARRIAKKRRDLRIRDREKVTSDPAAIDGGFLPRAAQQDVHEAFPDILDQDQQEMVKLMVTGWPSAQAAKILQLSRRTFYRNREKLQRTLSHRRAILDTETHYSVTRQERDEYILTPDWFHIRQPKRNPPKQ